MPVEAHREPFLQVRATWIATRIRAARVTQGRQTPLGMNIVHNDENLRMTWGFAGWQVLGSNQRRLSRRFYR
jgi:hypothetical protein